MENFITDKINRFSDCMDVLDLLDERRDALLEELSNHDWAIISEDKHYTRFEWLRPDVTVTIKNVCDVWIVRFKGDHEFEIEELELFSKYAELRKDVYEVH